MEKRLIIIDKVHRCKVENETPREDGRLWYKVRTDTIPWNYTLGWVRVLSGFKIEPGFLFVRKGTVGWEALPKEEQLHDAEEIQEG